MATCSVSQGADFVMWGDTGFESCSSIFVCEVDDLIESLADAGSRLEVRFSCGWLFMRFLFPVLAVCLQALKDHLMTRGNNFLGVKAV